MATVNRGSPLKPHLDCSNQQPITWTAAQVNTGTTATRPGMSGSSPSVSSYHASLTSHLSSLLSAVKPVASTSHQSEKKRMYTDMKALAERDKEHMKAWCLEGYKRYMGGVKEGFVLGRQEHTVHDEAGPSSPLQQPMVPVEVEAMPGQKRKRRYTEEPGLLERRRKVLRASIKDSAGGSIVDIQRGQDPGDALTTQDIHRTRSNSFHSPRQFLLKSDVFDDSLQAEALEHIISPFITPGLAFVPSAFDRVATNRNAISGLDFAKAIENKDIQFVLPDALRSDVTFKSPAMPHGILRRNSSIVSESSDISRCLKDRSTSLSSSSEKPYPPTQTSGSIAHISAVHFPIGLPGVSSPLDHHHSPHSAAVAALMDNGSATMTSLTGTSMGCMLAKSQDGLTGSSCLTTHTGADTPAFRLNLGELKESPRMVKARLAMTAIDKSAPSIPSPRKVELKLQVEDPNQERIRQIQGSTLLQKRIQNKRMASTVSIEKRPATIVEEDWNHWLSLDTPDET